MTIIKVFWCRIWLYASCYSKHFRRCYFQGVLGLKNAIATPPLPLNTLWCLLTTSSYSEAVLKAVNLGEDTDTTAAVTGGLAGIYYGFNTIPSEWVKQIARKDDIIALADRLKQTIE